MKLVQIDANHRDGRDILPSRGESYLSEKDDSIYEVLDDNPHNMYTHFRDIETGVEYHVDLISTRFKEVIVVSEDEADEPESNVIEL